jgi:pimeloyl-ACP methyl ester carboxylesterase
VLASPAGVPAPTPEEIEQRRAARLSGGIIRRSLVRFAEWCWQREVTLMDIIRSLGPFGNSAVRWVIGKRFGARLEAHEADALSDYLHSAWVHEASGELALFSIMGPWVVAKQPMVHRLHNVPPSVPILALFGQFDWMQKEPLEQLAQSRMPHLHVCTLPACGHQLFIENPDAFNASVVQFCRDNGRTQ